MNVSFQEVYSTGNSSKLGYQEAVQITIITKNNGQLDSASIEIGQYPDGNSAEFEEWFVYDINSATQLNEALGEAIEIAKQQVTSFIEELAEDNTA